MREAYIVSIGRSAIGKAGKNGALAKTHPVSLGSHVLKGTLAKIPTLDLAQIDDVLVGTAFPEAEQGMNIGRLIAQNAGIPDVVPGQTINRFCSSGVQTIATAANAIMSGQADVMVAGGIESMSSVPMGGDRVVPDPELLASKPDSYISMGLTAENVATKYNISRTEQDQFSVESHLKLAEAQADNRFADHIIPMETEYGTFEVDQGVRPNSSIEGLAKLTTIFKNNGSVTAGNASQISDGASFVVLMSKEKMEEFGLTPLAKFKSFAVVGLDAAYMGLGPIVAVPKALKLAGLEIEDIDLVELNEAFASQSLACIRELNLDPAIVNVNGGAIAHGHPLGATGAILTTKLISEMKRRDSLKYGLVTMCIGGGMGAAAIYEVL